MRAPPDRGMHRIPRTGDWREPRPVVPLDPLDPTAPDGMSRKPENAAAPLSRCFLSSTAGLPDFLGSSRRFPPFLHFLDRPRVRLGVGSVAFLLPGTFPDEPRMRAVARPRAGTGIEVVHTTSNGTIGELQALPGVTDIAAGTHEVDPPRPLHPYLGGPRVKAAIAIGDVAFHHEVLDYVGRQPGLEIVASITDGVPSPGRWSGRGPLTEADVLLVCPRFGREVARDDGVAPTVLLIAQEMTVPVLRTAIEAGAQGAFCWPEERTDLIDAIRSSAARSADSARGRGAVLAVLGSRGGAGATFLATHLAATFAHQGHRTVLVDMDHSFGDLTAVLGLIEGDVHSIQDLVPVADELSPDHVSNALIRHEAGFDVLLARSGAPVAPSTKPDGSAAPAVPIGLYAACAALLAGESERIVLHLPRALGHLTQTAIRMADMVVLVTGLDLMALYGARRALEAIRSTPGGAHQAPSVAVVLNATRRAEVTPAEAERVLGVRPAGRVRSDASVALAQSRVRLVHHRRPAWRDVDRLASRLDRIREEAGSAS
jgi:cellulose biosynthesis protein BcsQ